MPDGTDDSTGCINTDASIAGAGLARHLRAVLTVSLALQLTVPAASAEEPATEPLAPSRLWALSVYGGIGTNGGIEEFPGLEADFNDAYMVSMGLSRELWRWRDWVALETEANIAQHFNMQDHTEGNLLVVARWLKFPWNHRVRTSIAVGEGVSYASAVPEIERERSPSNNSRLLNYLMMEAELGRPGDSRWSFVVRIHHRSGVFGLFDGVNGGSNIVAAGIRYGF